MQGAGELINSVLNDEISFDQFSESIQKCGVESIAFDMVKRERRCYTGDGEVFDYPLEGQLKYDIGNTFKKEDVVAAIAAFDRREITANQFNLALAAAGVSFGRCYLKSKQALYLSPWGEFYLEKW